MKISHRIIITLAALFLPLCPALGQQRSRPADPVAEFQKAEKAGMQIIILNQKLDGSLDPVDSKHLFKAGDRWKIRIETNFRGYLYLININPRGSRTVIFPKNLESNAVESRQPKTLPQTYDLEFDEQQGDETLQILVSRERISKLDEAIKENDGALTPELAAEIEQFNREYPSISVNIDSTEQSRDPVFKRSKSNTVVVARPRPERPRNNPVVSHAVRMKKRN